MPEDYLETKFLEEAGEGTMLRGQADEMFSMHQWRLKFGYVYLISAWEKAFWDKTR